jgi:hypothetical protein
MSFLSASLRRIFRLHEQQSPGSIYHPSFRNFLQHLEVVQTVDVTIPEINTLIADSIWNELFLGMKNRVFHEPVS